MEEKNTEPDYLTVIAKLINVILLLLLIIVILIVIHFTGGLGKNEKQEEKIYAEKTPAALSTPGPSAWKASDTTEINKEQNATQIKYGRELIVNTATYFGPQGNIFHTGNGMNCQNCHLEAGTKPYGNNYSAVASTYPKFRERSGRIETVQKRVNDCFERSLNGKAIDTLGKEMQAIVAYIHWLGKDITKGEKPEGSGLKDLAYLERAADPQKGQALYMQKCVSCHGAKGQGELNAGNISYRYPPLWGEHSYNTGAGLYRLSRFASYIKNNMPQGATFENPQLSEEEAWDIAAFVNSQERPGKDLRKDWPDISRKPVDHPFGPYTDKFTEQQHKYGPFGEIAAARNK